MSSNKIFSVEALIAQLGTWHRQKRSGTLEVIASRQISWRVFFKEGMLTWLAGGPDQNRRWKQIIKNNCPELSSVSERELQILTSSYREYLILSKIHQQGELTTTAAAQVRKTVLLERFFDLFQYIETNRIGCSHHGLVHKLPQSGLSGLPPNEVYLPAWIEWQKWVKASLKGVFPDSFVLVERPPIISRMANIAIKQLITDYVDGTSTLRQIALKSERDLLSLAQGLMPLINAGGLSLSPTPHWQRLREGRAHNKAAQKRPINSGPLIAAIDDSPSACRVLQEILSAADFRVLSIPEPLKALPTLVKIKPDLILLDLLMPQINGYQLCSHLRQVTTLKKTPIIFFTAQEGIINRVKAKMVGANGYLTKPISAEKLLGTITQHLRTSSKKAEVR
ncbi:MAG: response regulator [Prochloraceae cyanobacterium]